MNDDTVTRERILEVATELFADLGYRQVSARLICKRAQANHAAINYYFRNKLNLYQEVLFAAYEKLMQASPMPRLKDEPHDPEKMLALWLRWYLERLLLSPETRTAWRLIGRELHDPSEVFDMLSKTFMRPVFGALEQLVGAVLGPNIDEVLVRRTALSVIAQCLIYLMGKPMVDRLFPNAIYTKDHLDAIADHIITFSIAGVHEIRVHGSTS